MQSKRVLVVLVSCGRRRLVEIARRANLALSLSLATGIVLSLNEAYLAIGCGDGDLHVHSVPDGIEIAVLPHEGAVTKFALSSDGNFLISAGVDAAAVLMWIVSPDKLIEDVRRRLGTVNK